MTDFEKVVDFIWNEKGVDVKLGETTVYLGLGLKRIFIHRNYNLNKNGLYALLHEVGHALQPEGNIGVNYYKNIDEEKHPKKHNMHQFLNELDAWNRGYDVAMKLNICIDNRAWDKLKNDALITYFK
jgi:hypothetical protein